MIRLLQVLAVVISIGTVGLLGQVSTYDVPVPIGAEGPEPEALTPEEVATQRELGLQEAVLLRDQEIAQLRLQLLAHERVVFERTVSARRGCSYNSRTQRCTE